MEGKLRGKRRDRGVGFEDSDSDDEESRGPRKPLNKKRRVEGDTLDTYGKPSSVWWLDRIDPCLYPGENPETRPFYNAYQADLAEDEDSGLAYLQQQDSVGMHDRDDGSGEEEVVDPAEVRRQVLEIQHGQVSDVTRRFFISALIYGISVLPVQCWIPTVPIGLTRQIKTRMTTYEWRMVPCTLAKLQQGVVLLLIMSGTGAFSR